MTTLGNENLCADATTAKSRAHAMKTRMKELGHEIPLTHAYEALATSCGYRNWATMKAQLSSSTAPLSNAADEPVPSLFSLPVFKRDDGFDWQRASQVSNRSLELVYGPPGKGKSTLMHALGLHEIRDWGDGGQIALLPLTTIDLGGSSAGFIDAVKEAVPTKVRHLVRYIKIPANRTLSINPFDTQIGLRVPDAGHQAFLVNFLSYVVDRQESVGLRKSIAAVLEYAIVELYRSYSDRGTRAKRFERGQNGEVDHALDGRSIPVNPNTTWWDVVDGLFDAGLPRQAAVAQRHAVPTLSDLTAFLQQVNRPADAFLNGPEMMGATMACFVRIEEYIKRMPIRSLATNIRADTARVLSVDLSDFARNKGEEGHFQMGLAFLLARHAFARDVFFDADATPGIPDRYRDHHHRRSKSGAPRAKPDTLVYDDVHLLDRQSFAVSQIMSDVRASRSRSVNLRIASQTLSSFPPEMVELADRNYIVGASPSPASLLELSKRFGLTDEWLEVVETRITGPTHEGLPFLVSRKRFDLGAMKAGIQPIAVTLKMDINGLWALTSGEEDATLRNLLAAEIGMWAAVKALGKRFPSGSAGREIQKRLPPPFDSFNSDLKERVRRNVIEAIVAELAG